MKSTLTNRRIKPATAARAINRIIDRYINGEYKLRDAQEVVAASAALSLLFQAQQAAEEAVVAHRAVRAARPAVVARKQQAA